MLHLEPLPRKGFAAQRAGPGVARPRYAFDAWLRGVALWAPLLVIANVFLEPALGDFLKTVRTFLAVSGHGWGFGSQDVGIWGSVDFEVSVGASLSWSVLRCEAGILRAS